MHLEPLMSEIKSSVSLAEIFRDRAPASPDAVPAWLKAVVIDAVRAAMPPPHLRWISAAVGANVRLVCVDDVLFFRADSKYTLVVTADSEVLIRRSLRDLRSELDPSHWWTIHRSTIVNVRAIDEVRRKADGRIVVSLKRRADVLCVSEAHERQFRQM